MPRPKTNNGVAMFDIRPTDQDGQFDVQDPGTGSNQIDLRPSATKPDTKPADEPQAQLAGTTSQLDDDITRIMQTPFKRHVAKPTTKRGRKKKKSTTPTVAPGMVTQQLAAQAHVASSKEMMLKELEQALEDTTLHKSVDVVGGKKVSYKKQKPRPTLVANDFQQRGDVMLASMDDYSNAIQPDPSTTQTSSADPQTSDDDTLSPVAQEVEAWLEHLKEDAATDEQSQAPADVAEQPAQTVIPPQATATVAVSWKRRIATVALGVVFVAFSVVLVNKGQTTVTRNLEQNGQRAIDHLESAKGNLETLDFKAAAQNFNVAYQDFNATSGVIDKMGASLGSVVHKIPGLSKVGTASNLAEAGRSISAAGEHLSLAFATLSERNILTYLQTNNPQGHPSIAQTTKEFKDVLLFARRHIDRADTLTNDIDVSVIPEDKREMFQTFQTRIPEVEAYIESAIDYADFLLAIVGEKGMKRYMVLLANNSELRATGGFPGSYAIVTFEDGRLKDIFIDDIYQIDGQIRKNVIPPRQLQHITPNLGVRDAPWFADFPTSAQQIQKYYALDGGGELDGVISLTPTVIERLLHLTGPIAMPEYDMTLTADNFLPLLQNEVEIVADRRQPKQIVFDFGPRFIDKLVQQDKTVIRDMLSVVYESIAQKHILAYFNDPALQTVAVDNQFGGQIQHVPTDYLQVVLTNIRGSKTDFVTDTDYTLTTDISGSATQHTLNIKREHNGGLSIYPFYNKVNSTYVRVYVPQGSMLTSIDGNTNVNYKPLVNYEDLGFERDDLLASVESTSTQLYEDVDVFTESGKTVFGFWLNTDPQDTSEVTLTYHVPYHPMIRNKYELLWQKQSGTVADGLDFTLTMPEGHSTLNISDGIQRIGRDLIMESDLSVDRIIKADFN